MRTEIESYTTIIVYKLFENVVDLSDQFLSEWC